MGVYLGCIEKKGYEPAIYFNFKPIYEISNGSLIWLSPEERKMILPNSEKENINFSYNFNNTDQRKLMDENFSDNQLIIFEFDLSELLDNLVRGERNQTGYKVLVSEIISSGKVRSLEKDGMYLLLSSVEIKSNFYRDNIVEVEAIGIKTGMNVLLQVDNDFIAGPYQVGFREIDQVFYIRPQIKENKYTVSCYKLCDCIIQEVSTSDVLWNHNDNKRQVVFLKQGVKNTFKDVISDTDLLEGFKLSISNENAKNGIIDISKTDQYLEAYKQSILSGSQINEDIRNDRLKRLEEMITTERDLDTTLSFIAESLGDSLNNLLIKYQDNPTVDELIKNIIDRRPDFIDRIQNSRIIREQKAKLEQELDSLKQEKEIVENEIDNRRKAVESIEQSALEQKTKELLNMDERYSLIRRQLDETVKQMELVNDISALQEKHKNLSKLVSERDIHKSYLEEANKHLETAFSSIINNYHDRMVNIAFDDFMANRMIKAAAQWETEEVEQLYDMTISEIEKIEYTDFETQDLIEYLCKLIKYVRPQYTKNTIINIAICISQGFLTVFSGEPGCGKTSICNIFAEVLGLNKIHEMVMKHPGLVENISRYVPVSVERGWTSKRDFIGYYNPLTKVFDKSNKRIYDGMKILDLEKKKSNSKFPFVILLDEANLSPMEYYWADFMNVCDDLNENSVINLGNDYSFSIPDTLHFVATINNDHTTETLSPRLLDRAWVIMLHQFPNVAPNMNIPKEYIQIVSWASIKKAFLPKEGIVITMTQEAQQIYDNKIIPHLKKARILISPRTDIAIKKFWAVATECFDNDEYGNDSSIVALDYAIAQKILTRISGNGTEYEKWLEELRNICSSNNLNNSSNILKDILGRGNDQLKYYQFFG